MSFLTYHIKSNSGKLLFSYSTTSLRICVEKAISLGINLTDANLEVANLVGANLREANFAWANFKFATLADADLRDAKLHMTDFTYTYGLYLAIMDPVPYLNYNFGIHKFDKNVLLTIILREYKTHSADKKYIHRLIDTVRKIEDYPELKMIEKSLGISQDDTIAPIRQPPAK